MMNDAEILTEMNTVIGDILDQPDLALAREMSANDVEGWDSLAHINIIVAMEKMFSVRFALGEVKALKTVGDFVDLVKSKQK